MQFQIDKETIVAMRREYGFLSEQIPLKKQELKETTEDLDKTKEKLSELTKESSVILTKSKAEAASIDEEIALKKKRLTIFEGELNVRKRQMDEDSVKFDEVRAQTDAAISHQLGLRSAVESAQKKLERDKASTEADLKAKNEDLDAKITQSSLKEAQVAEYDKKVHEKENAMGSINDRILAEEGAVVKMKAEVAKNKVLLEEAINKNSTLESELKEKMNKAEATFAQAGKMKTEADARKDFLDTKEKSLLSAKAKMMSQDSVLKEKYGRLKVDWESIKL